MLSPMCSKRKHKQQSDLLNRVNQETLRQGQTQDGDGGKSAGRRISEIVAYRTVDEVPATKDLKIEARASPAMHEHDPASTPLAGCHQSPQLS